MQVSKQITMYEKFAVSIMVASLQCRITLMMKDVVCQSTYVHMSIVSWCEIRMELFAAPCLETSVMKHDIHGD